MVSAETCSQSTVEQDPAGRVSPLRERLSLTSCGCSGLITEKDEWCQQRGFIVSATAAELVVAAAVLEDTACALEEFVAEFGISSLFLPDCDKVLTSLL